MNKEDVKYIRIINFGEEANKMVNKAIRFSVDENCGGVTSVHLLLAILSDSKTGKNILDAIDVNFDMLYDTYQMLASKGNYGFSDYDKDAYIGLHPVIGTGAYVKYVVNKHHILSAGVNIEFADATTITLPVYWVYKL